MIGLVKAFLSNQMVTRQGNQCMATAADAVGERGGFERNHVIGSRCAGSPVLCCGEKISESCRAAIDRLTHS